MKKIIAMLMLTVTAATAHAQDFYQSSEAHLNNEQYSEDSQYADAYELFDASFGQDGRYDRGDRGGRHDGGGRGDRDRGPGRGGRGDRDRGPGRGGYNLPAGSYLKSCEACDVDAQVLTCTCTSSRGRAIRSSLYYRQCYRGIENTEGYLTCL